MQTGKQFNGWRCCSLVASVLAFSVSACGEKTAPQPAPKTVAPAVQPAPPPAARQEAPRAPVMQPRPAAPANADEELVSKVKAALGGDGGINVHRIDVTAEKGVVTLYGTADTADQRARAENIAAGVIGVKAVKNKLAIVAGS